MILGPSHHCELLKRAASFRRCASHLFLNRCMTQQRLVEVRKVRVAIASRRDLLGKRHQIIARLGEDLTRSECLKPPNLCSVASKAR